MRPCDVYTDPKIVNSLNSALEHYEYKEFEYPRIGDIVLFPSGVLRTFDLQDLLDDPNEASKRLIFHPRRWAHEILSKDWRG